MKITGENKKMKERVITDKAKWSKKRRGSE